MLQLLASSCCNKIKGPIVYFVSEGSLVLIWFSWFDWPYHCFYLITSVEESKVASAVKAPAAIIQHTSVHLLQSVYRYLFTLHGCVSATFVAPVTLSASATLVYLLRSVHFLVSHCVRLLHSEHVLLSVHLLQSV